MPLSLLFTFQQWEPYECTFKALEAFASVYDMLDKHPDKAGLATDAQTARALKQQGRLPSSWVWKRRSHSQRSVFTTFVPRMGVRYTLTHAGNNEVCDSSATKEKR